VHDEMYGLCDEAWTPARLDRSALS
jgi:hypothetical protein